MPWRAWGWVAFIVLITALVVIGDRFDAKPYWRPALDAVTGLWCALLVSAHFDAAIADLLGRATIPVSLLIVAWVVASSVFDAPTSRPYALTTLVESLINGVVLAIPLALGIRRGLDYWRSPTDALEQP